ncbi:MAG: AAA family ATPase [Planctomycetota bacterium]
MSQAPLPKTKPVTPPDLAALDRLRESIASVFMGDRRVIDRLLACLLARGHVLIEDVPGVGKTVLATALARSLGCAFSRIQLTPDLLPADVLGVSIYDRETADFVFKRGPIFANVVLADEINRTTPRTQSALLEAMSEGQVSIEGKELPLEPPFMVVATQNPLSFEGTYPLPENQLDRFLMRLTVGYPNPEAEARVLDQRPADNALKSITPVMSAAEILSLQHAADQVRLDASLREYMIAIATASRNHDELAIGISPRGTLALAAAARATALLDGRAYCIPEDITQNLIEVCAHRVVTRAQIRSGDTSAAQGILETIMQSIASPA